MHEECFGDEYPARRCERWRETRALAARRRDELIRGLLADEERAPARYRATAVAGADLDRDNRTARDLLEQPSIDLRGVMTSRLVLVLVLVLAPRSRREPNW